jgi:hypothetical protein
MLLHNLSELRNRQSMVSILLEQLHVGLASLLEWIVGEHTIEQGMSRFVGVRGAGLDLMYRSDVATIGQTSSDESG